jgi:hypothetical protein
MQPYPKNAPMILTRRPVQRLCVVAFNCLLLFIARAAGDPSSNADGPASVTGGDTPVEENSGPTVMLFYGAEPRTYNPISSFMYFIPLISLTDVHNQTSANNDEVVNIISYERKIGAASFSVACEFEIRGSGFHKNSFDPVGVIASRSDDLKKDEVLTKALDYIKFEGEGFGCIAVEGTIDGSTETVREVSLQFNARGRKSPVTIGLYDIAPQDGLYTYANRSNEMVARVNSLCFTRTDTSPRMGLSVASIAKAEAPDGYVARIKGVIANLLLKPPKIDKLGNDTMLDFGYAILKQQPEFTFPLAKNLREEKTVAAKSPRR